MLSLPHVPLYRQLYDDLRRRILSGALPARSQMPSTRNLARQLSVSRMTVVSAYKQLLAEGYITAVSGSGTFVAAVLPEELLEIKNKKRQNNNPSAAENRTTLSRRGRLLSSFDGSYLRARTDGSFSAFHYGLPAMDTFPFDIWTRIASLGKYVGFLVRFRRSGGRRTVASRRRRLSANVARSAVPTANKF